MILSDTSILAAVKEKAILIDPFDRENLGPNSYDLHLGKNLLTYSYPPYTPLDPRIENTVTLHEISVRNGSDLVPGVLYLGVTEEYTETLGYVPYLDGKSSVGRLGICVHLAGRGDVGFCGHWTLEISVVQPVTVYPGMPIAQITYHTVEGRVARPYQGNYQAHGREADPMPIPSRLWKKL